MIVFELVHTYYTYKNELYSSIRCLGFFQSKQHTDNAIAFFQTRPGYCDSPNAFSVRRRKILGSMNGDTFYEAMVYAHTYGYYYEFTVELGLFASKQDAQNTINAYRVDNEIFYRNTELEIEEIINEHRINDRYCKEGFVVESIEDKI